MSIHSLRNQVAESCRSHAIQAVQRAEYSDDPFPHFFAREFFPAKIYADLLAYLPATSSYEPASYEKHVSAEGDSNRFVFKLRQESLARLDDDSRQFWLGIRDALGSVGLQRAVYARLAPGLAHRYGIKPSAVPELTGYADPALYRETAGYRIAPHPDTRRKVVTMQIALPRDDSQVDIGTEFYRRSLNPASLLREPRGFEIVKRSPFLPNAAYAFSVLNTLTRKSWHGRSTLASSQGVRNSLLNLWYENAASANPEIVEELRRPAA